MQSKSNQFVKIGPISICNVHPEEVFNITVAAAENKLCEQEKKKVSYNIMKKLREPLKLLPG